MRYLIATLSILTLLWLGVPALVAAAGPEGRIEGKVTNLTTNTPPREPLPSVEIVVNGWMVLRSGSGGEWNITGLKPGEYSVELRLPPGYSPAQGVITATVWGNETRVVDLGFYEGAAPPMAASITATVSSDRVAPLGATPAPLPDQAAATPAAERVGAFPVATPAAAILPGQGGAVMGRSWSVFWLVASLLMAAGIGLSVRGMKNG